MHVMMMIKKNPDFMMWGIASVIFLVLSITSR